VSRRMAGGVHGAEAWDGNGAVPGQKVVDRRRFWHRHEDRADPLYGFEDESFCASDDWRVGLVRDHPSTGSTAQLGHASSVVGVLVGEQDGRHLTTARWASCRALSILGAVRRPGRPVSIRTTPSSTTTMWTFTKPAGQIELLWTVIDDLEKVSTETSASAAGDSGPA
jgi:hypothetical protein